MASYSVLIARFPYGGIEDKRAVDWLLNLVSEVKNDERITRISHIQLDDTPITMTRNKACRIAQEQKFDFLLMLDSDMSPDLPYPNRKPFFQSSLDFLITHQRPAIIAAPYCGPPPNENIYVFRWRNFDSETPDISYQLSQYTREEAAERAGIEEVAALPTGLLLMHTDALEMIPKPWFQYEYTDDFESDKCSTEDVYFTRNASLRGVKCYVNWDAWAGHVKKKVVGKPHVLTADAFALKAQAAMAQGKDSRQKLMHIRRRV